MRPQPQTGQQHQNGIIAAGFGTVARAGRQGLADFRGG